MEETFILYYNTVQVLFLFTKFTMLLITMWYYLYLYKIVDTSFCFLRSNLCSIVTVILFYHFNIVTLKYWLKKTFFHLYYDLYSVLSCSCNVPAPGSGSVFRVFGILGIPAWARSCSTSASCCRPKAAWEEQIQTAAPTHGSAADCNSTTTYMNYIWIDNRTKGFEFRLIKTSFVFVQ